MQGTDSNPAPSNVNHIFQNSKTIQVECSYDIETINYKNKNPQIYLMVSNPFSVFGKISVIIIKI